MKFHVRTIQFDILLVLNKYSFKTFTKFLDKSKSEFLLWLKEYITEIILKFLKNLKIFQIFL